MKCVVLKPFGTAQRGYGVGDTADFPDKQAREFITLGYVKPALDAIETSQAPPHEQAVTRKRGKNNG